MAGTLLGIARGSVQGSQARNGTERQTLETRVLVFRVIMASKDEGIDSVLATPGIPKMGDAYQYNSEFRSDIRVRKIDPRQQEENPVLWIITVTYEIDVEEQAEVEVDFEIVRVPATGSHTAAATTYYSYTGRNVIQGAVEQHGKAVTNSAGEAFDPPIEVDEGMMVLRISRNERVGDLEGFARLNNSTNADQFFGAEPRQWRMFVKAMPIPNHIDGLWRVMYELHYRRLTWDLQVLDQGRYHLVGGVKTPFLDNTDSGHPILGNLNGAGAELAAGLDPVFIRFTFLRVEQWPVDLEATVTRFYSVRGGGGGIAGRKEEDLPLEWLAEARKFGIR